MMTQLWGVIIVIGIFTGATRIAPLFLAGRKKETGSRRPVWLDTLGPCLLAAMAVAVILPHMQFSMGEGSILATAISFAIVSISMIIRRDPGLATIAGMIAYFLLS